MRLEAIIMGIMVLCTIPAGAEEGVKAKVSMGSVAYLDTRYEFREVRFGTPFDKLGFDIFMQCRHENSDLIICNRSSDKEDKTLGAAHLLFIDYVFFKDSFIAIDLWIDEARDGQAALAVLKEAYGQGSSGPG